MLLILSLIVAAGAAMALAVGTVRRPLICCPAAALAAGSLLVMAGRLATEELYAFAVAALLPGVVAAAWGLLLAFQDADRRAAEELLEEARARFPYITDERPDLGGHTITVERVDRETARAWIYVARDGWESLIGRRAVVERHDGRLGKVCAIEGVESVRSVFLAARATASTYGARYVPAGEDSSSYVVHGLAAENAAGGAR